MNQQKYTMPEKKAVEKRRVSFVVPGIIFLIFIVLIGSAYWYAMSSINKLEKSVLSYISESIDAEITVENTSITRTFRIILDGVKGRSRGSKISISDMEAKNLVIAADIPSLLKGKLSIKEIFLNGLKIRIYSDGTQYNFEQWLNGATQCDHDSFMKKFPKRINVKSGTIVLEPVPGSNMTGSITVAEFDGSMGMTQDGALGTIGTMKVMNSVMELKGGLKPCSDEDVDFRASAPVFNFGGLKTTLIDAGIGQFESEQIIPVGTGRLNLRVSGPVSDMYLQGDVSTRDFDARFSLIGNTLQISDFKAGLAGEKFSGKGKAKLDAEGIPFEFFMELEGIRLSGMLGKRISQDFMPEGTLSGMIEIKGRLSSGEYTVEKGSVLIEDGMIKIPVPETSFALGSGKGIANIPFKKIEGRLSADEERLSISAVEIEGEGWSATGSVSINSIMPSTFLDEGRSYSLMLDIRAEDSRVLLDKIPGIEGKAGGVLSGSISLKGVVGSRSDIRGNGKISLRDGFMYNPYATTMLIGEQLIDFDFSEVVFDVYQQMIDLTSIDISGDGLDVSGSGNVSFDGALNIDAQARMSSERLKDFPGMNVFPVRNGFSDLVTYNAKCEIYGTLMNPVSRWSKPSITRWE